MGHLHALGRSRHDTITFTAPQRAWVFFEAMAADNLDIGRPDNMEIIVNWQAFYRHSPDANDVSSSGLGARDRDCLEPHQCPPHAP